MTSKRGSSNSDIYVWFLQVLTILVLAFLAIWATLTPKTPTFTITNMDLKPYIRNDTALATTNSSFLALNVTISNPNKMIGVFLDEINVTIGCNNESLIGSRSWSKSMAGFYLGHSVSDLKEVDLSVDDNELSLCRKVDYYLRVGLDTGVRYKIMWFKTRHHGLVFEDYVEIGYGHGQMLGTTQMKLKLSFTNL